jgi:hypothetical protein
MTLTMSSMIRVFLHQNLVTFPKIRNILFAGIVSEVYRFGIFDMNIAFIVNGSYEF